MILFINMVIGKYIAAICSTYPKGMGIRTFLKLVIFQQHPADLSHKSGSNKSPLFSSDTEDSFA